MVLVFQGGHMDDSVQEMFHQLSLERQQMLEEAIQRAENCEATKEDFDLIRYECGLTQGN
jgi:hypothetical protein